MEKNIIIPEKTGFEKIISQTFEKNGLGRYVSDGITGKLADLGIHMIEENAKYNLTSILKAEDIALLHFTDSLIFEDLFPLNASVLDIGAGAGFPSLPLAIVRPDLRITSLDSTQKKCDYIANTAGLLRLDNISVICGRAEEVFGFGSRSSLRDTFDVVTARAVASLPVLCELACAALKNGGCILALKGPDVSDELPSDMKIPEKTGLVYSDTVFRSVFGDEIYGRNCVIFRKTGHTDSKLPRRYAEIKKRPLF